MVTPRLSQRIFIGIAALAIAALACSAPGVQQPDTAATVAAVYATITAQANLPPDVLTASAATAQANRPTSTPGATAATATPPDSRGTPLVVHHCGVANISMDAKGSDWPDNAVTFNVDQVNYDPNKEWNGAGDLSGSARLCWTDTALLVLVNVNDDVHFQTQHGIDSYKGDEVELMFDADLRGDFSNTTWDGDDYQLSLNPGDLDAVGPELYRYRPTGGSIGGSELSARGTPDAANYRVEARIAWADLGGVPVGGKNYGLCIGINDADHPDKAPNEDTLISSCPGLSVSNPTTWASVTFVNP